MSETHAIPDEECLPRFFIGEDLAEELDDMKAAYHARKRADAWARSPKGTPYGAEEPTR